MKNKGFTLIELSIVLVIIGLLVGGIMGGQALVQQAKLQKLGTQLNQYKLVIDTFKMQYNAIPGDMSNASNFWPGAKNGNGNGKVEYATNSTIAEDLYFWNHLTRAGLIDGNYSDTVANPTRYVNGINCPSTSIGGSIMTLYTLAGGVPYEIYGNYLTLGLINPSTGNPSLTIMTSNEHFALNSKFDNGDPSSGNILAVRGANNTSSGCVDANPFTSGVTKAQYVLTDTTISCRVFYRLD